MAEIDSLEIKISAQSKTASKAIDDLCSKLDKLTTSLGKINGSNLSGLSNGVEKLGKAVQALNGVKSADYTRIAKGLDKFAKIDASGLSSTSSGLNTLARSLSTLSNIQNIGNITPAINAIKNLARVDMSGFDTTKMQTIANTMSDFATKLSSVGKIESSVTRVVSSMARLANSGQYISNVATYFPQLGNQAVDLVGKLSSANAIDSSITKIVDGIAKLASAGKKIEVTVANLDNLGDGVLRLLERLQSAPQINANIANTIQGLGNLASSGNRFSAVAGNASGAAGRFGNALKSLKGRMTGVHKSSKGLASSIGSFYQKFFPLIRVVKRLWKATESSMDYVEVLNYFNAGFGQVADKADISSWEDLGYDSAQAYYDSFAKRAESVTQKMSGFKVNESGMLENTKTKSLGLNPSELMNYQAMFGQMSSSMGMASENALTMSEVMTKLGADLASVKNLDFNKTWNDMSSGLAGMSRTLDKYGANIRNVNLQQKLNELGIKANISALNQNDKAMLRAIIILESTDYAWGDLSKTIEQPANQLRLLKSNFSNLARTIGNIFLPIVAKVLPYLNALVIALQRLAEGIVKMLGFKDFNWGGLGGGKTDNDALSNIYDDADSASESIDDVTDAAKELKNELMGFDKINKLSDITDTDSDKQSGINLSDSAKLSDAFNAIASDYLNVWEKAFNEVDSKAQKTADKIIDAFKSGDFKGIGKYVGKQITKQLKKINWKPVYKVADKFGSGLADFLNGLISPELFTELGNTIAGCLNTALHFLDSFGTTFDWKNFGNSIAAGVNSFFKTFDFALLADTINVWVNGILDTIITFIDETDWYMIGQQIGIFLSKIDFTGIGKKIGKALWKAINAGINLFKGMFDKAPIETTVIGFTLGALAIAKLSSAFSFLTSVISSFVGSLAPVFSLFTEGGLFGIGGAIATASAPVLALVASVAALTTGLGYVFATNKNVRKSFLDSTSSIVKNLKPAIEFLSDTVLPDLKKGWNGIIKILTPFANFLKDTFTSIWQDMINPALGYIGTTVVPTLTETFKNLWKKVLVPLGKYISSILKPVVEKLTEVLETLWKDVILPSAEATAGIFSEAWKGVYEILNKNAIPYVQKLIEKMQFLWDKVLSPLVTFLTDTFLKQFKSVFGSIKGLINGVATTFKGAIKLITGLATGNWKKAWQGVYDIFKGIWDSLSSVLKMPLNAVIGMFESLANGIIDAWNGIKKAINSITNIKIPDWVPGAGGKEFGGFHLDETQHIKIKAFAVGGFPEEGPFFMNRGEIAGKFGNGKSVVANNQQITQGIADAVYPAVYNAVSAAINNSKNNQNVNIVLEGDAKGLFKAVKTEADTYTMLTGQPAFNL